MRVKLTDRQTEINNGLHSIDHLDTVGFHSICCDGTLKMTAYGAKVWVWSQTNYLPFFCAYCMALPGRRHEAAEVGAAAWPSHPLLPLLLLSPRNGCA